MNQFLNAREFVESLRISGNDFADEILDALDFAEFVEHDALVEDIEYYVPKEYKDAPRRAVEWLGDRHLLLSEIEDILDQAGFKGAANDVVQKLLDRLPEYDL